MESVLEKVRALLAKAASTTSEDEAANCASLAQKLLAKHNLTMEQVDDKGEQVHVGEEYLQVKYGNPWRSSIVTAACRLYYCDIFTRSWFDQAGYDAARAAHDIARAQWLEDHKGRRPEMPKYEKFERPGYVIIGREHNRVVAAAMIHYLWATTLRMASTYMRENSLDQNAKRAFERGCGERLATRLHALWYEALVGARKAAKSSGTDLIIYDAMEQENKDFMKANYNLSPTKRRSSNLDSDHADAGWEAGERVSLAPQVGTGGVEPAKVGRVLLLK